MTKISFEYERIVNKIEFCKILSKKAGYPNIDSRFNYFYLMEG